MHRREADELRDVEPRGVGRVGVPTSTLRSRSTAGRERLDLATPTRSSRAAARPGSRRPASSVTPVITNVAPAFVCLNSDDGRGHQQPERRERERAEHARAGRRASAVGQRRSSPNTSAANASDSSPSDQREQRAGTASATRSSARRRTARATIRSNVPASSSARSVATGVVSVEVRTPKMTSPTTTNA